MSISNNAFLDHVIQGMNSQVIYGFTLGDAQGSFTNGSGMGTAAVATLASIISTALIALIYIGSLWVILSELYNWGTKGGNTGEAALVILRASMLPVVTTLVISFF